MTIYTPIANTKRACERALKALLPTTKIAFENIQFTPPNNEMYIRTQFVVRPLNDPVMSSKFYRERISFQVFVIDLPAIGTNNALTIAETIRARFDKGTCFSENGTRILVLETPQIAGNTIVENRLVTPVLIDLIAETFKEY